MNALGLAGQGEDPLPLGHRDHPVVDRMDDQQGPSELGGATLHLVALQVVQELPSPSALTPVAGHCPEEAGTS